jgi:hypothetical protein
MRRAIRAKRQLFQFGLTTLFVAAAFAALPFALHRNWINGRRAAIGKLLAAGAVLDIESAREGFTRLAPDSGDAWRPATIDDDAAAKELQFIKLPHDGDFEELFDAALAFSEVKHLDVSGAACRDAHVARISTLGALEGLNVADCNISRLPGAPVAHKLWFLVARNTNIDDAALLAFDGRYLIHIDLSGTRVSSRCGKWLERFASCQELRLARTNVDDQIANSITKLAILEYLDLSDSRVTDAGVQRLVGCSELHRIYLDRLPLGPTGIASLNRKRFPYLRRVSLIGVDADEAAVQSVIESGVIVEVDLATARKYSAKMLEKCKPKDGFGAHAGLIVQKPHGGRDYSVFRSDLNE